MEERQVTMDGVTYQLGVPFMVVATQNPIEHEGTYPLPEAQRDRFMLQLEIGYPTRDAEIEILETHGQSSSLNDISPVADAPTIATMIESCRTVHVAASLKRYIVDLMRASRDHGDLALGASPRAALALLRAARAAAAVTGRDYVIPDDIKPMVGRDTTDVLTELLESVPIPIRGRGEG